MKTNAFCFEPCVQNFKAVDHVPLLGRTLEIGAETTPHVAAFDAPVAEKIDRNWQELVEKTPGVFNGPLVHLHSVKADGEQVSLNVSQGLSYKTVVGLRAHDQSSQPSRAPSALGVMILLVSSDNQLMLRWRNGGDWEPGYELPGGFIRQGESLSDALTKRLMDDFSLTEDEVESSEAVSFYRLPGIFESVILFRVRSKLTAAELLCRTSGLSVKHDKAEIAQLLTGEHALHLPTISALEVYRDYHAQRILYRVARPAPLTSTSPADLQ